MAENSVMSTYRGAYCSSRSTIPASPFREMLLYPQPANRLVPNDFNFLGLHVEPKRPQRGHDVFGTSRLKVSPALPPIVQCNYVANPSLQLVLRAPSGLSQPLLDWSERVCPQQLLRNKADVDQVTGQGMNRVGLGPQSHNRRSVKDNVLRNSWQSADQVQSFPLLYHPRRVAPRTNREALLIGRAMDHNAATFVHASAGLFP